jgi:zinc protease
VTSRPMKSLHTRIFSLSLGTCIAALAAACAHAPPPESAMSVITAEGRLAPLDSVTVAYDVAGIHVIQRPNYANDAVAVNVYLLGGTRQLTVATQGIESLLLHGGEYGTQKYPGGDWRAAWGLTGSRIVIDPEADWTVYGFRGIRQEFDSSWDAFADRLTHPTLSSSSLAIFRARLVADSRLASDDPDMYIEKLADSVAFTGQPYGLNPDGTEATLAALDSATVARYEDQIVKSRLLLVVVGNVTRAQVEAAVSRTLAALPVGNYTWTLPSVPNTASSSVNLRWRTLPTNYVVGVFRGPDAASPSSPAFRVAIALLSTAMTTAIREERGLSYAANAIWIERGATAGAVYISTGAPTTALPLISKQMDYIRHIPGSVNIHNFTDQFIVEYFAENMTNAAQADFLARAQLYQGDYRRASQAMEDLRHVSASDVHDAATRYFNHIHFVYLGDTTRVDRKVFAGF